MGDGLNKLANVSVTTPRHEALCHGDVDESKIEGETIKCLLTKQIME